MKLLICVLVSTIAVANMAAVRSRRSPCPPLASCGWGAGGWAYRTFREPDAGPSPAPLNLKTITGGLIAPENRPLIPKFITGGPLPEKAVTLDGGLTESSPLPLVPSTKQPLRPTEVKIPDGRFTASSSLPLRPSTPLPMTLLPLNPSNKKERPSTLLPMTLLPLNPSNEKEIAEGQKVPVIPGDEMTLKSNPLPVNPIITK